MEALDSNLAILPQLKSLTNWPIQERHLGPILGKRHQILKLDHLDRTKRSERMTNFQICLLMATKLVPFPTDLVIKAKKVHHLTSTEIAADRQFTRRQFREISSSESSKECEGWLKVSVK